MFTTLQLFAFGRRKKRGLILQLATTQLDTTIVNVV